MQIHGELGLSEASSPGKSPCTLPGPCLLMLPSPFVSTLRKISNSLAFRGTKERRLATCLTVHRRHTAKESSCGWDFWLTEASQGLIPCISHTKHPLTNCVFRQASIQSRSVEPDVSALLRPNDRRRSSLKRRQQRAQKHRQVPAPW